MAGYLRRNSKKDHEEAAAKTSLEDMPASKAPFWVPPLPGERPRTVRQGVEFQKVINGEGLEVITYETPVEWDGGPIPKYSKSDVEAAVRMSRGIWSEAARILKVSPSTMRRYRYKWPHLEDIREEANEDALDHGEAMLQRHIDLGSLQALTFYLSTRGKERGFTKRTEKASINVDLSQLSDSQLELLTKGKKIEEVLLGGSK
jgi:hypothetical protein